MAEMDLNDLRAAVAADIITEKQATAMRVMIEKRIGYRDFMKREDEPFEFFSGFAEIFVTVGLSILFTGILGLLMVSRQFGFVAFSGAGLAFALAFYFTLNRRMNLPSMWLATVFAVSIGLFFGYLLFDPIRFDETDFLIVSLIGFGAMLVWYRVFHLPFTMFLVGIYGIAVTFSLAALIEPSAFAYSRAWYENPFDLNGSSVFSYATLAFGLVAFVVGMWFDTQDPYRIGRKSAAGFWLHLIAAPALVNTIALSLYNMGGTTGYLLTALALTLISLMALIVDRRSFLTAGILYMAALLVAAFGDTSNKGWSYVLTLLVLGVFITVLGTWWGAIRAGIMRALPGFPLKHRLPPYDTIMDTE
ncbi:hypothetical protein LGT41_0004120 [Abyssibius alkaniclasticus]|uniref:hypothetical protein n=1 Tax=Abyssibius alkaniclasticus TaxID=2881234 RepID=UPI0023635E6C|nr:hypothetical protein [Abyssibius alkaniclasticus]UPH72014.1 hypothetical protein LGT41_0004120 [Abyssibius alkaniclasticus]